MIQRWRMRRVLREGIKRARSREGVALGAAALMLFGFGSGNAAEASLRLHKYAHHSARLLARRLERPRR